MTMVRIRTGVALVGLWAVVSVAPAAQHARPETALRAAMDIETVKGDLPDAIAQYQRIVETYQQTNRAVAAQALLRMAGAHRKAGDADRARRAYTRIVNEFADRPVEWRQAQSGLGAAQTEMRTTRLGSEALGRLSTDGRFFLRYSDGHLRLVEFGTKTERQLTSDREPKPEDWDLLRSVFSPTGDRVAYGWYSNTDERAELRILSTAGSMVPRTIHDNAEVEEILPFDWSRDGRWIAVIVQRPGRIAQIGLVSPEEGSLRVLQTVDWRAVGGLRFSPDSKWLAFHRTGTTGDKERTDRDVVVMALDRPRLVEAVATPADETVVSWTPDGDRLLVLSDRGGSNGIWAKPFRQGEPSSSLELVRQDVGIIEPSVLTPSGVLYYSQLRNRANIHLAPLDVAAARVTSPVQPVQKFVGSNTWPEWSRDGKYFSYTSQRRGPGPHQGATLVIQEIETGERRELSPGLPYMDAPQWSPDGRHLIVRGATSKAGGIVRIDLDTGKGTLVVPNEICSGIPTWASKGTTFFCFDFGKSANHAVEVDALTGTVVRRYPDVSGQALGVSPDGRYLLHHGPTHLMLRSLEAGESRPLIQTYGGLQFRSVSWTPDAQYVTFNSTIANGGERAQWLVPISGGAPRKIDVGGIAVSSFRINPVTGQVLYSPDNRPEYDAWKMENFLSSPVGP